MPRKRGQVSADDVITVARELLRRDGFGALSVRRLAETLGVSRQVVYTHFGGMDGLLNHLHRLGAALLAQDVAALTEMPGTDAYVLAAARAYLTAARQRPALFELVFAAPIPQYAPNRETIAASRASFGHLIGVAASWLASHRPMLIDVDRPGQEAVVMARVIWSLVHGHIILEIAGHARSEETDALVETGIQAVLRGWRR
ncbi:MAG: TetR/AcrR family transcriptional regulator [Myxococcota bacterium]